MLQVSFRLGNSHLVINILGASHLDPSIIFLYNTPTMSYIMLRVTSAFTGPHGRFGDVGMFDKLFHELEQR